MRGEEGRTAANETRATKDIIITSNTHNQQRFGPPKNEMFFFLFSRRHTPVENWIVCFAFIAGNDNSAARARKYNRALKCIYVIEEAICVFFVCLLVRVAQLLLIDV